jgi:Tfp pilus assembly protein PilO
MMNHSSLSFSRYRFRCHVVAAFVCVLFGGIQYVASMARTAAVRAELNSTLNQRQSLVGQSEALMQRLESLQSEERRLVDELQSLRVRIPYKTDDHAFLESLAHEILEFQPGRAESEQQFENVPVRISAICNWPQLCQFLYRIKGTSRLCSVDEVRISLPDTEGEELQLNLTIRIFSAFPKMMAQASEGVLQ